MKGKDIINEVVRDEMPDKEQLRQSIYQVANITKNRNSSFSIKRFVPVALCFVVVLTAVVVIPKMINNNDSLRGLPVDNFNLANIKTGENEIRISFNNFGDLFKYDVDYFTIVKITDTHIQKKATDESFDPTMPFDLQISDAYVLQNVYNEVETNTIQITQAINDHFAPAETYLLRKGAVYLLPLRKYEEMWYDSKKYEETWVDMGALDVLFEVDNKGIVWSHSNYEEFNRFDGKSIVSLINELQEMVTDEEFMLANSSFAHTLEKYIMADITITNKSEEKTDKNGVRYFEFGFDVNEILSAPDHSLPLDTDKDKIKLSAYENSSLDLIPETRYLIFLEKNSDEVYAGSNAKIKVNDDETLTILDTSDDTSYSNSVYEFYEGYNLAHFRDLVSRIKAWNKAQESKVE